MNEETQKEMCKEVVQTMRLAGIPVRVTSPDFSKILYPQKYHAKYCLIKQRIRLKYEKLYQQHDNNSF